MKQLRHLIALSGLAVTMLWMTITAAAAQVPPPEPLDASVIGPAQPPTPDISSGSQIWAFAVVAATAVALTIATLLTTRKVRHSLHPRAAHV